MTARSRRVMIAKERAVPYAYCRQVGFKLI
jgi:hypothetical protein